jgi:hypothetical protein
VYLHTIVVDDVGMVDGLEDTQLVSHAPDDDGKNGLIMSTITVWLCKARTPDNLKKIRLDPVCLGKSFNKLPCKFS